MRSNDYLIEVNQKLIQNKSPQTQIKDQNGKGLNQQNQPIQSKLIAEKLKETVKNQEKGIKQ
jgi:hypothetical protein